MKALKDIFVPYEISKKLKEIGFDESCIAGYCLLQGAHPMLDEMILSIDKGNKNYDIPIPTYEQVFKWFREKELFGNLNTGLFSTVIEIRVASEFIDFIKFYDDENHYEVAREQLILKLIEIYKKSSKQ